LRSLNAQRSPVFTAKCDTWAMSPDELAHLLVDLDMDLTDEGDHAHAQAGFASYIDMVWRERQIFTSFHQQEQILHRLRRHAEPLVHPQATAECVIRPALVDLTGPQEGYAVTLYVRAFGVDGSSAEEQWGLALGEIAGLIRAKDLALM
jgi:hypothetical protein